LFISQYLSSQVNIKIVDEEDNPIQSVKIFNKNTGALISTSSYDGSATIKHIEDSIRLFSPNFIEKTLYIDNSKQNISIVLERRYTGLKEIEVVGNSLGNKALVVEAYVRNYIMEADSLTGYVDAIVDCVVPPPNSKENNVTLFLKEYRVLSPYYNQKNKKRWLDLSISNVNIPTFQPNSVLNTQKNLIQIKDSVIYLKKYTDSIVGNIHLKNDILRVQLDLDKAIGDTVIHNFLGYRVQFLQDVITESHDSPDFDTFLETPEMKRLISKNRYQKVLIKHKKDDSFNIIEKFSDVIILRYKYIKSDEVKTIKKRKYSPDKSSYQDEFWVNYMESLPLSIKEKLKNMIEL
jgi:hypothetical protein